MYKLYKKIYYISKDKEIWKRFYAMDDKYIFIKEGENEIEKTIEVEYEEIGKEETKIIKAKKVFSGWEVESGLTVYKGEKIYIKRVLNPIEDTLTLDKLINLPLSVSMEYLKYKVEEFLREYSSIKKE